MKSDEVLASKTVEELKAAIKKANDDIAFTEAIMPVDWDQDMDGPFAPSKDFENWTANYSERRVSLLRLGIRQCEAELARRNAA